MHIEIIILYTNEEVGVKDLFSWCKENAKIEKNFALSGEV